MNITRKIKFNVNRTSIRTAIKNGCVDLIEDSLTRGNYELTGTVDTLMIRSFGDLLVIFFGLKCTAELNLENSKAYGGSYVTHILMNTDDNSVTVTITMTTK